MTVAPGETICEIAALDATGAKAFVAQTRDGPRAAFVARSPDGATVWAYVNSCPHIGSPLDLQDDVFLTVERDAIQCSTHGALFALADGACFHGPCKGRHLAPVPVGLEGRRIVLMEAT